MSNWAEDMLLDVEREIDHLESLEENETDELTLKHLSSMKSGLQKQLLELYRHAISEGTPFEIEKLKLYESYHRSKKLYLSDPQLEERNMSPIMRTKSAEEEMMAQLDEKESQTDSVKQTELDLSFLSRRQREVVQLFADGLTYSDIADMLGVKKGTVSKHLQLARSKAKDGCRLSLQLELCMDETVERVEPKKRGRKKGSVKN